MVAQVLLPPGWLLEYTGHDHTDRPRRLDDHS